MSSGYYLLIPAFTAGWYAHWYFKLRPFAREVERTARDVQGILDEARTRSRPRGAVASPEKEGTDGA